jgi:hypothetical protein
MAMKKPSKWLGERFDWFLEALVFPVAALVLLIYSVVFLLGLWLE